MLGVSPADILVSSERIRWDSYLSLSYYVLKESRGTTSMHYEVVDDDPERPRDCVYRDLMRTGAGAPTASRSAVDEETSTRPVGRCLTSVYLQYWRASSGTHFAAWCPLCSVALSGQAPTPHSGAPKARGLTAKARTEQSSALPQCAWLTCSGVGLQCEADDRVYDSRSVRITTERGTG